MGYSFDGVTKIVSLTSGTTEFDAIDVYSRWKEWVLVGDNAKYLPAMRAVGGDPISVTKNLGSTYFLTNGWRIQPDDTDHRLTVNGNLYTDPSGFSPFIATDNPRNVIIEMQVSSLVDSTVAQLPEIQHSVYENRVVIDVTKSGALYSGTAYPVGTLRYPVNNLADAKTIAINKGFNTFFVIGNLTIGSTESISGYFLGGNGPENTIVTLTSGCSTHKTTFRDMSVTGRQSGETHYLNCDINPLDNVHCVFNQCRLIGPMTMSTTSTDTTSLFQCYTAEILGVETVIDMNNSRVNMVFNDFNGKLKIINMNHLSATNVIINMGAGKVTVDSSCTTGTIKIRGNGEVIDNSNGTIVDNDVTANLVQVAAGGGLTPTQDATLTLTYEEARRARALATNKVTINRTGNGVVATDMIYVYDDDGDTILYTLKVTGERAESRTVEYVKPY